MTPLSTSSCTFRTYSCFFFLITVLKIQTGYISLRYDVCSQSESNNGNDCSRNHIGPHHSFKTHSGGEHGNDFRVFCQLGSKEDNSDKDKQGAEQIGEVRDEVHVIIKYNRFQRSFIIDEPVYISFTSNTTAMEIINAIAKK